MPAHEESRGLRFRLNDGCMICLKINRTSSNSLEVLRSSPGSSKLNTVAVLDGFDQSEMQFDVDQQNGDIFCFKMHEAAHIELLILGHEDDYQSFKLQTSTSIEETNREMVKFGCGPDRDMYVIKHKGTESAMTELRVLCASSNYQELKVQTATALGCTRQGCGTGFAVNQVTGNLWVMRADPENGDSSKVEILAASDGFQSFCEHATRWVANKVLSPSMWSQRLLNCLEESFASGHLTNNGPCCRKLEVKVREFLQVDETHAVIAVANATLGISVIACAVDMERKDRGLPPISHYATQSLTFPSSAQGAFRGRTAIVDVTPDGDLDLKSLPEDCQGIIVTNVMGTAGNLERYHQWWLQDPKNRVLIMDNAAAPFTTTPSGSSHTLGVGSIVSLHHTKTVGFGEGGVVILSRELEKYGRRCINFGFDYTNADTRVIYEFESMASNMKISDLAAAACLLRIEDAISLNLLQHSRNVLSLMQQMLCKSVFKFLLADQAKLHDTHVTPGAICLLAPSTEMAHAARSALRRNGFFVAQYYRPLQVAGCPNATSIFDCILCLPCHEEITAIHVEFMVKLVQEAEKLIHLGINNK